MAALADYKSISAPFSNAEEWHQVTYDFAADTGAQADLDVFVADGDLVITGFYAKVVTAGAGAGNVNDLGIGAGGTEFWSNKAVGSLTLNAVVAMDTAAPVKLASGSKIVLGIETGNLTAGKFIFNFKIKKF